MTKNGLRSFSFHKLDNEPARRLEAFHPGESSPMAFVTAILAGGLDALDPEAAARIHIAEALASPALPSFSPITTSGAEGAFEVASTRTEPLTRSRVVKFRQTFRDVPVYGSLVTVEMDAKNDLLAFNSSLGEPANVDPIALISPRQALDKARALAGAAGHLPAAPPELFHYFDEGASRWRLAYVVADVEKARRRSGEPAEPAPLLVDYVIDAHSGELIKELPRALLARPAFEDAADDELKKRRAFRCVEKGGVRILHDPELNVHTHALRFEDIFASPLPGPYVTLPPEPWSRGAISAHANAVTIAEFLRDVLRRNGLDGAGGPLVSTVDCVIRSERGATSREWQNAAWYRGQMIYGQQMVDGALRSYAASLDVVAHEIFHGVTERTARLEYLGEPGALNESYSDIFGVIVSNYAEADRAKWNFELGEDLNGSKVPLRDLANPERRRQPAHLRDYRHLPPTPEGDYGGVHVNSGIHNKAASLVMTARDAKDRYLFSTSEIAALFYLTLAQQLSYRSGFSDSRRGVALVARTLFRDEPAERRAEKRSAIDQAFDAVGIL